MYRFTVNQKYIHMKNQKTLHRHTKQNFLYTLSLFVLIVFSNTTVFGQKSKTTNTTQKSITVKGTVYSEFDNLPLEGTAVTIKNTIRGTETDDKGNFEINNLKEGDILSIYYTSFKSQEITVKEEMPFLKIYLEEDSNMLDTVLVGDVDVNATFKTKRSLWKRIASIF